MFQRLSILVTVLGLALLGQSLAFAQDKAPIAPPSPDKPAEIPKPPAPDVKPDKVEPRDAVEHAFGALNDAQWTLVGGAAALVVGVAASGHGSSGGGTTGSH
jgi:hypothetical protein